MGDRVLVTRPEPGASRTAARLEAMGHAPVVVPLTKIAPLRQERPGVEFGAVAASSANALRHAFPGLVRLLADKPLYAVGAETANAAREAGFDDVRPGEGTAEQLARLVATETGPGVRVAYLCGRIRRDVFEADLRAQGIDVVPIETYVAHPRKPTRREIAALDDGPIDAALVYSANAAKALVKLVEPRRGTVFAGTAFIAISARVADILAAAAPERVVSAATPDEDAMFALLS